ncbi:MAG: hypothetical protein AAF646_07520 [Pseudomonadota bacterium]
MTAKDASAARAGGATDRTVFEPGARQGPGPLQIFGIYRAAQLAAGFAAG